METLETFVLDAGMNSSSTASFMGIHTNTVQYRLKKINDVLGVEITGNRVIPSLTIALALRRLESVVSNWRKTQKIVIRIMYTNQNLLKNQHD